MSIARPLQWFNWLRALACLSVLAYHLNQYRSVTGLSEWNWDLYQFVAMWPIAVSLFFLLSAATNSLSFWRSILRDMPIPKTRDVFISRFFRIAPAYYVALGISFILSLIFNGYTDGGFLRLLAGYTFLSWTHPLSFFPVDINGPLWYISYDMMWAIFVMSTMSLLARVRKIFIPFILSGIGWILIALHFWFMQLPFPTLDGIVSVWFPYYNPFIFALHFLVGIVVSGLLVLQEKNHTHHSIGNDVLFTLTTVGIFYFLWRIREAGDFDYSWFHAAHRFPYSTISIAFLLYFVAGTKYIGKWLDNHLFHTVARLSFSTYLWHVIVIFIITKLILWQEQSLEMTNWLILVTLTVPGSFLIAWLSYNYIEIPVFKGFLKWKEERALETK